MNNLPKYAELILPLPLPQTFTYELPAELQKKAKPGMRAAVQFGRKKIYTGVIHRLHSDKPEYKIKPISSILDEFPVITEKMFKFWEWIASYYMCTTGEVFKAALPSGMKPESSTELVLQNIDEDEILSAKEQTIVDFFGTEKKISIAKLAGMTEWNPLPTVKKLLERNILSASEYIKNQYKEKQEVYISLAPEYSSESELVYMLEQLKNAPAQSKLLMDFLFLSKYGSQKDDGVIPGAEIKKTGLLKHSEASSATLAALVKRKFFKSEKKSAGRLGEAFGGEKKAFKLNEFQDVAYQSIKEEFKDKNTVLLHGVTSSGKTEIYIKLIQEQLDAGKQVLYLLPEIALTSQIINRLSAIFGSKTGIYHSKFSDAERVETWNGLYAQNSLNPEANIILGVRSSVFLPFTNLGLIIVDEEHENTYKQHSPAPRYNARDASVVLAKIHDAKVLLGTATPSLESYLNAKSNKYGFVELNHRHAEVELPEILIGDIKTARHRKKIRGNFTPELILNITEALKNGEQVILFQNRRGFSPYAECKTCSHVPHCEHCDVSLTYHKHNSQLTCHYCGYGAQAGITCQACGDVSVEFKGLGTEKIEDQAQELFPESKIARMDLDSTRSKKAFTKIISDFENGVTNILIGTQMVSKGLDFGNVTVVGIMNADNLLNFPDFRAFERTFQLLTQVSGRAGRRKKRGKVILQTSSPKHKVIQQIINNDYYSFYAEEIQERQQYKYPPYYRLIRLTLKHKKQYVLDAAADKSANMLRATFGNRILGPEYPEISRIQNWYLKNIMIKIEKQSSAGKAKMLIVDIIDTLRAEERFKYVKFIADVDPF